MSPKNSSIAGRFFRGADGWLLFSVAALLVIGCFAVYSASFHYGISSKYITVQAAAILIGVFLMLTIVQINYRYYKDFDTAVYIISIILLIAVLVLGKKVNGARRWIDFGPLSFQPVEIAKLLYILVFASFLDKHWKKVKKPMILIGSFLLLMGHFILIMAQPGFSSTLSYFLVTLVLLYVAGAEFFYILCVGLFCVLSVGIPVGIEILKFNDLSPHMTLFVAALQTNAWYILAPAGVVIFLMFAVWWFLWKLRTRVSIMFPILLSLVILFGSLASVSVEKNLKDYQRKRIVVFLYPESDSRGTGYNVVQSKIAMGSGKLTGKGFLKGSQTQLGFLPEQHTDFIFSVIGEEGGWVFSQLVILLYFIFVWRALVIAREARDRYGSYIALGIASMFTFYAVINIAMVTGLMPVAGVPLLFLSYGGSSIVSSLCAVGVLISINSRRHMNG